jgi:hypothetical protein
VNTTTMETSIVDRGFALFAHDSTRSRGFIDLKFFSAALFALKYKCDILHVSFKSQIVNKNSFAIEIRKILPNQICVNLELSLVIRNRYFKHNIYIYYLHKYLNRSLQH